MCTERLKILALAKTAFAQLLDCGLVSNVEELQQSDKAGSHASAAACVRHAPAGSV